MEELTRSKAGNSGLAKVAIQWLNWNEQIFIKDLRAGCAMVITHAKKRKNNSFVQTITQLIYTKNQVPYNEFYNVSAF